MLAYRLAATVGIWGLVFGTGALSYVASARASALDYRVRSLFWICVAASIVGHLVSLWLTHRTNRAEGRCGSAWKALDLQRIGLSLLVTFLCVLGMTHVDASFTIVSLEEKIPPNLRWIYPALCLLAPIWLSRTAARCDAGEQTLLIAIGATTMSGALFLMPAHLALGMGLLTILMQLGCGARRLPSNPLSFALGGCVLLFLMSTLTARARYFAEPSMAWIATATCLCVATALRPRDRPSWLRLLSAPVGVATLLALCDLLVTWKLAETVSLRSALDTRIPLFQQHPNFLASCYAFHAVLAVGLGLSGGRSARLAWVAIPLLSFATWHTDSNAGLAALVGGLVLIPVLHALRRSWRRLDARWMASGLAASALLVLLGGAALMQSEAGRSALTSGIDRFERSVDYRADAWRNTSSVIRENPLIGIGPRNFITLEQFGPGSRFAKAAESPHPHNMMLYVAQSAGVIAMLGVLSWLALLLWRLLRDAMAAGGGNGRASLPIALLAACCSLLAANQLDLSMALDTLVPAPFFLVTGLHLARGAESRSAPAPRRVLVLIVGLFALSWPFVVDPVRARCHALSAHAAAYEERFRVDPGPALEKAVESLEAAIHLSPVVRGAYGLLARLTEGSDDAERLIRSYIEVSPDSCEAHSLLGRHFLSRQEWDRAADAFRAAVVAPGRGGNVNAARAQEILCLTRGGRVKEAQQRLSASIRIDRSVADLIPWEKDAAGRPVLTTDPSYGQDRLPPERLSLLASIQALLAHCRQEARAGRRVGLSTWANAIYLLRDAGQLALADETLDFMERNVEEIEDHELACERALVAVRAGRVDDAARGFERAYGLSKQESDLWLGRVALRALDAEERLDHLGGDEVDLSRIGDVIAKKEEYGLAVQRAVDSLERSGRHSMAAATLAAALLFEERRVERTELLLRAASLHRRAGELDLALESLERARDQICARPLYARFATASLKSALPVRIALELCSVLEQQGRTSAEVLGSARDLPRFSSPLVPPSQFRIGLYFGVQRFDLLLLEAEAQLDRRKGGRVARLARIEALRALGRLREARDAERDLLAWMDRRGDEQTR